MKRAILLVFAVITAFSAYSQSYIQDGDHYFDNGDYTSAVAKYNEAYKSTTGKDRQIAEIKMTRAQSCAQHLKSANQSFNSKNYRLAKESYQKVLETNPKDAYAKAQMEKCDELLKPPATTLSVSKSSLSFVASGGNETVTVTTNSGTYSIDRLPAWCRVQQYAKSFTITCHANTATTSRNGSFTVNAGDKTIRVNITQAAAEKKQETTLSVTKTNLSFSSSGGKSEEIKVYSNASSYSISLVPTWFTVQTYSGYFVVSCTANYTGKTRGDWLNVVAGGKTVRVYVSQSANTTSQKSSSQTYRSKQKKCFNCPKAKYPWGVTMGYVNKNAELSFYDSYSNQDMDGFQVGIKYEPLFKYGFGLNTGLFYEYYSLSDDYYSDYYGDYYNYDYEEHIFSIPLHLEYRFNLHRYFNLFVYGGASIDMITNADFDDFTFQPSFDYGGGVRIDHIQINIGQSMKFNKLNDLQNIGSQRKYKSLIVSLSYMF